MSERVVVLGASDKPARFANRAIRALKQHGHAVRPVNPNLAEVEGCRCAGSLTEITGAVDTISVYLRSQLSEPLAAAMIALGPRRVIFNPGSESIPLKDQLEAAGIRVQWNCTLVLLRSGEYQQ